MIIIDMSVVLGENDNPIYRAVKALYDARHTCRKLNVDPDDPLLASWLDNYEARLSPPVVAGEPT